MGIRIHSNPPFAVGFESKSYGQIGGLKDAMRILLLALALAVIQESLLHAQVGPRLILPDETARRDAEGTRLPDDVVRRFGSGLFRDSGELSISPSGQWVYLVSRRSVVAVNAQNGQQRFSFGYRGPRQSSLALTASTNDDAGIRIEFYKGSDNGQMRRPENNQYVVLEHDTGKELHSGELPEQRRVRGGRVTTLADPRRCLVQFPIEGIGRVTEERVSLWDVENNCELLQLGVDVFNDRAYLRQHSLALSHDRKRIAFTSKGRALRLYDADSGKVLQELPLNLENRDLGGYLPVWSRDDTKVYAWRRIEKELQIVEVDVESGMPRVVREDCRYASGAPVVSPNGRYLAYAQQGNYAEAILWNVIKLADLSLWRSIDVRPANSQAVFAPDSDSLWLNGECGVARYDLEAGRWATPRCDPFSHVSKVAFSPDGQRLYAVAGAELITWEVATGRECAPREEFDEFAKTLTHGSGYLPSCVSLDASGQTTVWTLGEHVRRVEKGKEKAKFPVARGDRHLEYCLSRDEQQIVFASPGGALLLADFRSGETLATLLPEAPSPQSYQLAIAPDNRTLAVVHRDQKDRGQATATEIELWDLKERKQIGKVSQVIDRAASYDILQFSADSQHLFVKFRYKLFTWDVATKKLLGETELRSMLHYPIAGGRCLEVIIDDSTRRYSVQMTDGVERKALRTWQCAYGAITDLALSADESQLAVVCTDGPVYLVNVRNGGKAK